MASIIIDTVKPGKKKKKGKKKSNFSEASQRGKFLLRQKRVIKIACLSGAPDSLR